MKRIKKYLAVSLMSLVLVSNSIPSLAAISSCPNGCVGDARLYSRTLQWTKTEPHTGVVNDKLVTCTQTINCYLERYVCSKCTASRGSLDVYEIKHSINHK